MPKDPSPRSPYIIGTRGSLLARTQTGLLKEELEAKTGAEFQVVFIKTQGDQIQDVPLWQVDGKNFFTKELDEALLKGEVDFVVHSYKDLGGERPEGIVLAAITERTFPDDVLLIRNETIAQIQAKSELIVGTSSPRRMACLAHDLKELLPKYTGKLTLKSLRGNVNTRIQKLKNGDYDMIVLALAGIERLALGNESRPILEELLQNLNFMVLPLSLFPTAAGQGALGIEYFEGRTDQSMARSEKLSQILNTLHHPPTARSVGQEKELFRSYGGGCHLAMGIHVREVPGGFLVNTRGEHEGKWEERRVLERGTPGANLVKLFQKAHHLSPHLFSGFPTHKAPTSLGPWSLLSDECFHKEPIADPDYRIAFPQHVYVSSDYCLPGLKALLPTFPLHGTLWAAGTKTFRKLAQEKLWVNGTADGQGPQELSRLSNSVALNLISSGLKDWENAWGTLTHTEDEWTGPELGSGLGNPGPLPYFYQRHLTPPSKEFQKKFYECRVFYWSSYGQFEAYRKLFPSLINIDRLHFCGPGSTYTRFKQAGIHVQGALGHAEFLDLASGSV